MKYKIAICDDDKMVGGELENYIYRYHQCHYMQVSIRVFYTGEEFCRYLRQNQDVEAVFLDIELQSTTGIEVGKFIRDTLGNEMIRIVYVSHNVEYAKELFQCRPIDFLNKPISYEDVEKVMDIICKKNQFGRTFFTCVINKITRRLPLAEIMYFESENRKIWMYLVSGEKEAFYEKLDNVDHQLSGRGFLRIHKSKLVNYEYVRARTAQSITMENGKVLSISSTNLEKVNRRILEIEMASEEE